MKGTLYVLLIAATASAVEFAPARRLSGAAPALPPPTVVGWLEETVDVAVDASGAARDVVILRGTAPSPTLLRQAVSTWRFPPATLGNPPGASRRAGAALLRPPPPFGHTPLGVGAAGLAPAPGPGAFSGRLA